MININKVNQLPYYQAICMFAAGYSKKEILTALKISERTLQHYFHKETFRDTLNQAIGLVFKSVLSKAVTFAGEGIDILIEISRDKDTPSRYRIQAIQTIFDILHTSEAQYVIEDKTQRDRQNKIDAISSYIELRETIDVAAEDNEIYPVEYTKEEKAKQIWVKLFPDEKFPDNL